MLEHLIERWGYVGIAVGTFVEGEAVLLCAGALAKTGLLAPGYVVLAATFGSLLWGETWFSVGRIYGRAFIERRPKLRRHAVALERWMGRYGGLLVVAFRFIAGAAMVVPVLTGAARYPRSRFLVLNAFGALLWASVFTVLGFGIVAGAEVVLGRRIGVPAIVVATLSCVLVVYMIGASWTALRRQRAAVAESPSSAGCEEHPAAESHDADVRSHD